MRTKVFAIRARVTVRRASPKDSDEFPWNEPPISFKKEDAGFDLVDSKLTSPE